MALRWCAKSFTCFSWHKIRGFDENVKPWLQTRALSPYISIFLSHFYRGQAVSSLKIAVPEKYLNHSRYAWDGMYVPWAVDGWQMSQFLASMVYIHTRSSRTQSEPLGILDWNRSMVDLVSSDCTIPFKIFEKGILSSSATAAHQDWYALLTFPSAV